MRPSARVPVSRSGRLARFAFLALASAAALTLAGCAGTVSGTGTAGQLARLASASPGSSSALSPQQRAQADAAAILADFAVPPGAKPLSAPPASVSTELNQPFEEPGTPYLVDKHSLWEVPGTPTAVLAWEERHVPRQFARGGNFRETSRFGKLLITGDIFSLPAVANVLNTRQLMVEMADVGDGQTGIRVDVLVAWIPPKPSGAVVPSAATAVTLSLNYGGNADGGKPPAPVTITAPATVGKVTALIDEVPPNSGATYNYDCPVDEGKALDLAFRARPGGPVLATVVLKLNGCGLVDLTVGKHDYRLGYPGGARATAAQVLKAAGVPWMLPPVMAS